MRNNIVHIGADELTYEIRKIVEIGTEVERLGQPITWENIGDPVAKGENIQDWIKDQIREIVDNDDSFGYGPTQGLPEARQFLADLRTKESGISLNSEDIVFFNGIGDAISKVFNYLNRNARVIGPSPAYSTHSSAEAAHAGSPHITYNLQHDRNWLPDIEDLRNKVHYNPQISGILIINPDNPTGMVYPKKILEEIVKIAEQYKLFILSDEIYANIVYGGAEMIPLADIINSVPGIALRGISKEMPWPGSRCGWIEIYNRNKDPQFARYVQTIIDAKMLEVCSTTLPQAVIPLVLGAPEYKKHLDKRSKIFESRAKEAYSILSRIRGIRAPKPNGAFYIAVVFDDDVLYPNQKLAIKNERVREFIEQKVKSVPYDKRFAYYLMGAKGICVVPLSGFNSDLAGFRATLLENDPQKFTEIFETLADAIKEYLKL